MTTQTEREIRAYFTDRQVWLRWMAVQLASIWCMVEAVGMLVCLLVRSGEPGFWWPWGFAYALLLVLTYGLHWRLQDVANRLDPIRTERVNAIVRRYSRG